MIELNDLYDYGLKIYQNSNYFKFSIDSLLLGEFVEIKKNDTILDMCTGNCPVPLLLLTKEKNLHTKDFAEFLEAKKMINKRVLFVFDFTNNLIVKKVKNIEKVVGKN